jgi:hypothetical protein
MAGVAAARDEARATAEHSAARPLSHEEAGVIRAGPQTLPIRPKQSSAHARGRRLLRSKAVL